MDDSFPAARTRAWSAVGRRSRAPLLVVTVALLAAGCASMSARPEAALAGCYQFRWDEGARSLRLPWGVVLRDEPVGYGWMITMRHTDVKLALTAISPTARDDHPFGYWRVTEQDSVELGHPGGGAGFTLTLAPVGQDLVGVGRAVGDVLQPGETPPSSPVTAYRVLCEAT